MLLNLALQKCLKRDENYSLSWKGTENFIVSAVKVVIKNGSSEVCDVGRGLSSNRVGNVDSMCDPEKVAAKLGASEIVA